MTRILGTTGLLTLSGITALIGLTMILAAIQTAEIGILALSRD